MSQPKISENEKKILDFVANYFEKTDQNPTNSEMADGCNIPKGSLGWILDSLVAKGYLNRDDSKMARKYSIKEALGTTSTLETTSPEIPETTTRFTTEIEEESKEPDPRQFDWNSLRAEYLAQGKTSSVSKFLRGKGIKISKRIKNKTVGWYTEWFQSRYGYVKGRRTTSEDDVERVLGRASDPDNAQKGINPTTAKLVKILKNIDTRAENAVDERTFHADFKKGFLIYQESIRILLELIES